MDSLIKNLDYFLIVIAALILYRMLGRPLARVF